MQSFALLILYFLQLRLVEGLKIPFQIKNSAQTECADSTCGGLGDVAATDAVYVTNITVGSVAFEVQLDTGSSDLWVNATRQPIPSSNLQISSMIASEVYGDGSNFTGPIATATVQFHGFNVSNQAFVYANEAFNDNVSPLNVSGLIGLGLGGLSQIESAFQQTTGSSTAGRSFLANLFAANGNQPDFISFLLSRQEDDNSTRTAGAFTISEIEQGYEAINNQQSINIFPSTSTEYTIPIDAITVGGNSLTLPTSAVTAASSANVKAVGLLDTGSQNLLAPPAFVSSVWAAFPGATAVPGAAGVFTLPCDKEPPAVTVVLGGQSIPLHPLDVNPISSVFQTSDGSLVSMCFGGIASSAPQANRFDFLLGTPLLKNAYAMFNFGSPSASPPVSPFIKILSTTDPTSASADFATTRKAQLALAPPASASQQTSILNGDPSFTRVSIPNAGTVATGGPGPAPASSSAGGSGSASTAPAPSSPSSPNASPLADKKSSAVGLVLERRVVAILVSAVLFVVL